jgi:transposase
MPILAELVDAVIGADTHRDTHTLEMCSPSGATLSTITVANTDAGFTDALTWVAEYAPGPQIAAGLEGTRSYGIGLARVLAAAGMQVIEVEQPRRADRRGRGKSDPIDAHLAALSVLRREVDTLSMPRADGAREGLRILLGARRDLVTHQTGHINQLRALLLGGEDPDRALARGTLPESKLASIARRRGTQRETVEQVIRRRECRRLALAIITSRAELAENKREVHQGRRRDRAGQDHQHSRAGVSIRAPTTTTPTQALALGRALADPLDHGHDHLTTGHPAPRPEDPGEAGPNRRHSHARSLDHLTQTLRTAQRPQPTTRSVD